MIKHVVKLSTISPSDFERVKPFRGFESVGKNDYVGRDSDFFRGSRAGSYFGLQTREVRNIPSRCILGVDLLGVFAKIDVHEANPDSGSGKSF
jgi:hypothetical protein